MTDFFMTRMGQRFYESTMPGLVKQLADLNENLRKQNEPEIKLELSVERKHVDALQQERDELWSENQRLKGIARGLDFERELRSRAETNLTIEKEAHQFTRQLHATAIQRGVNLEAELNGKKTLLAIQNSEIIEYLPKLDLVNKKLGITMGDSFEHFREQLNNALDDD